jgi:hypothetical protein
MRRESRFGEMNSDNIPLLSEKKQSLFYRVFALFKEWLLLFIGELILLFCCYNRLHI